MWVTEPKKLLFFSCSAVSNSLQPQGLQHTRLSCPSPTPRACSNSCPSSHWCHPTISPSVVPFSSCLLSSLASGSSPVSWFFASGGQSIGASASASVLPMNIQGWFPVELTGLIFLQSKGLSRVFSNTTVYFFFFLKIYYLLFFKFYFIFKLYIIVLVLPNIKMNPPQVYLGLVHWDDPEGGNGEGGGRRVQDGEHMNTTV